MVTKKKPVAKKSSVKRPAKRVAKRTDVWEVMWVRTVAGEEFIAECKVVSNGVFLHEPTMITYMGGNLVLAPYGMLAENRGFFFAADHVLHLNPVTNIVRTLYDASLESSKDYCQTYFDQLVEKSISTVQASIFLNERGPTSKEMNEVEQMMGEILNTPDEFSGATEVKPRSRQQTIDDLMKLAESVGKGKKPSGE